ncbi:MAG TPA: hypothetical protein VNG51_14615 [Ktedonobacteraceae bacterium]|nr:hypothetical protein [Ktedonobacteraceae bacterium]
MGQDLGAQITGTLNQNSPYNIVVTTVGNDTNPLRTHLSSIPGAVLVAWNAVRVRPLEVLRYE